MKMHWVSIIVSPSGMQAPRDICFSHRRVPSIYSSAWHWEEFNRHSWMTLGNMHVA